MTKKRFNVSSTLNKNKKENLEIPPALAEKIPLTKSAKNMEEVKEKVEEIHQEEVGVSKTTLESSTPATLHEIKKTAKRSGVKKTPATKESSRLVRLTIDTPEEIHRQLKIKSVIAGVSMRDYILRLLEKELRKG